MVHHHLVPLSGVLGPHLHVTEQELLGVESIDAHLFCEHSPREGANMGDEYESASILRFDFGSVQTLIISNADTLNLMNMKMDLDYRIP